MKGVLAGALALPATERAAFLSKACEGDEMRRRAESLLADEDSADAFLEAPALEAAAAILDASRKHAPALTPGQRLGRYEILSPLGAGGMGEVYRARDSKLKRDVAVKVLPAYVSGDPERLSRFEREANAVAAISHPNILSIFDFGSQDDVAYAVMELLEGETLREKLQAPPSEKQAVDWALQVARGLSAAHEKGIVHRDLKPENLFVGRGGHLKILDFGLAKREDKIATGEETGAPTVSGHTEPGTVMGTIGYMSPEQVRGLPVDHRSDIFSFGAILYELVSGRNAFKRQTVADTMAAILKEEPPALSNSERSISPALDHIIRHCLEKDRERRFQSARDIEFALEETSLPAVTSGAELAAPSPGKRKILIAVAAIVVLAVGSLLLMRWPRRGEGSSGGMKRVAVLPFENLGSAEDDYFADGIGDAVRGKLTSVPGLQVIARGSSTAYKRTTKTPRQIAQELNAFYLLTATVRWQKSGGPSRVQVSPELIDVTRSDAPTARWHQPFDAALTDVFRVQADIASRVAQALGVAIGAGEEKRLSEKPTQNLAAYDAFLKGEEASASMGAVDPPSLRKALVFYEQAVALDPRFAHAWAQVSRAGTALYFLGTPTPALAERARQAADTAVALAPDRPEGYLALGNYHFSVARDPGRALQEYGRGQRVAPSNADLFAAMAYVEQVLGRWEDAVERCRQAERLDPRSVMTQWRLGQSLTYLRRYPEAREAFDRGLALAPSDLALIQGKAMLFLNEGDFAGARGVLAAAPVESTALVAHIATYWDLVWILDEAQREMLLRMTPSAFDDDRGSWGLCLAQAAALKGDGSVRAYAEEARKSMEEQLRALPQDPQRHVLLGLALAYLGRTEEAIREGVTGLALHPFAKDAVNGAYFQHQLVRIYMLAGQPEKALDQLEPLLKIPTYLSPGWLEIDPNFDPLRKNPRFQKLVAGAK